jgi:hypothetical protein
VGFFAVCLLLLAAFIPLRQNGDNVILSVMSLQKLTVYYWSQDRFGGLTPLLAAWIRHPLYNLYAQLLFQMIAGFIAPVFFCSFLFRRSIDVWRATLLTDGLLLIGSNVTLLQQIFIHASPYGMSLACAGLASMAVRTSSPGKARGLLVLAGTIGLVIAYIVNFALVVIALPLVLLFMILLPSTNSARLLAIHLLAAIASFLLPRVFAPEEHTNLSLAPSFHNIVRLGQEVWSHTGWPSALAVIIPIAATLLYLIWVRRYGTLRLYSVVVVVMLGVAALNFALVASSRWIAANLFDIRYFVPTYLLLMAVAGMSLWLIIVISRRDRPIRSVAFVGLSTVLLLAAYLRLHSNAVANTDIMENGEVAREVAARYVSLSLDGIAGDYWYVWPAVLMAEQYHYDTRFVGPNVFGFPTRGHVRREEFMARLAAAGRLRLACIDLAVNECATSVSSEMRLQGLRFREFAPPERLSGKHWLSFAEVQLAEMSR